MKPGNEREFILEIPEEGQPRIWEIPDFNQAVIDSQLNYAKALQLGFACEQDPREIGVYPEPIPLEDTNE
ncbi:hypothetical protein J7K50_08500 [bacterium]|nr:hypothetical protein [bacterium]